MAQELPPIPKGFKVVKEELPPIPKGFKVVGEKKNPIQPVAPTGSKPSKTGSSPFQTQEDTKYAIQDSVDKFRGGTDGYNLDDIKGGNNPYAGIFKTPSVLLSDEQKLRQEQERIGKRFETTLLNTPTEFGKVANFVDAAKKVKDTLPQAPQFRKYGQIPMTQPTEMTEGQRLGESLTKGTDVRELITDKLTGKKTGLQKQLENAENAFRAYQGDEIANQAQGYIRPEETLKIKQELGFGERMSDAGTNFVNRLERFPYNTSLALGQTLTTLLGEDLGSNAYTQITRGGNAELHRMEAFDKLAKLDAETKYSKGIIDSIQDLDLVNIAGGVVDAVGSLVSTVVTSAPTAGLGLYGDMVGGGLYDFNSTKARRLGLTVDELYDTNQNEFFVPAIINGAAAKLEGIGLKGIKSAIMNNMSKGAGQKFALVGHGMNREGVTEWLQTGMEVVNTSLAEGKPLPQAVEESVKTLFSKKGAESYLMGAIASGAAIGGGRILKGLFSDKSKKKASEAIQSIEQQQEELSNPELSNESRVFIWDNIQNNVTQLVSAVDEDVDTAEGLSAEQRKNITILNDKISSLEVVANDPAASEETKSRALESIKGIQETINDITSKKSEAPTIEQPTFDTEESIGEEVRESNRKFQAGEIDQATWEQEQKDLNKRAENIIPVPEDAEIGKPEEVVSEDVEAKKADIEKRRQEELNENSSNRRIKEEVYEGIGIEDDYENRYTFYTNSDGSRTLQYDTKIDGKWERVNTERISKDNTLDNETYIEKAIANNRTAKKVSEDNNPRSIYDIKINAKYDAELAALEQQTKPKEDAIQEQAAGQVPVQPEAPVSEEVEQGEPEAKPEVVTEEGKEEVVLTKIVEQLRADEQAKLKAAIPNAEQYLTDGKVDRAKITDAKDLKKFDEIYDKYDRLITPLLPKKEVPAPKQEAPAKAKAAPKLTSKVDTKLKIKALSDLDNKIKSEKSRAKKSKLEADKLRLIEKNPSIGYVYDNFKNVLDQLVEKGLISSDGKKVVYEGKPYATNDFASVLHDGLLDQMVQDGIVDDSRFTPMLKTVEKTDDQITREQTRETEMLLSGTAEKRRAEGKFVKDGVEYVRNPKNQGVVSSLGGKVKFTNDIFVPFKYKLVEAETLQPSHQNGRRNPLHFIPEAQPKNRNDEGSIQAEESFANKPRFGELGKADAYSGAPVVNERNEVVQGNNRSAGLKKGYDRNNQQYKNDLIDNAEEFGFSEEQVRSMKSPILVRQIASNDQGSIELGNYDVKDLETAGTRRIDPVATTRRMPFGAKGRLAELMFSGEDTLNKAIRKNQKRIIEIISPYLNQAQRSTIIKDGALTDIGVNDIEDIAKQFLFDNGDSSLPDLFDNLSATQKEGLRRALPYLFSVSPEKSLIQDIQVAIIATNDFLSSDTRSFDSWLGQGDMFNDGMTPKEKYTPLEIAIARLLVEEKSQKGISNVFLDYAKAVADKAADMFGPETKGKSRKEGVLEIFKVEDNEKPDSTGGGEAVGAEQEIEGQETERKGINIRATPSVQKKEPEVKIKALSDIEAAKEKFAKAKEMAAAIRGAKISGKTFDATLGLPVAIWNGALETVAKAIEAGIAVADAINRGLNYIEKNNKGQWNNGAYNSRVIQELGLQAKVLFEQHKELVGLAKAYRKADVKNIEDFAAEIGESLTQEVKDAWDEAKGISKKTLSDFKAEAEKIQAKQEEERLAENEKEKLKGRVSGIKKGLVSEDIIESVNLDKISDTEMQELGKDLIESGEVKPRNITLEIAKGSPRALQPKEVVALIYYKTTLDNQKRELLVERNKLADAGDDTSDIDGQLSDIQTDIDLFDITAVITAQQQSLAFRLRRNLLDKDYNLVTEIEKYKKTNKGVIPSEVEAKFRKYDKQLTELKEKIKKAEEKEIAEQEGNIIENIKQDIARTKNTQKSVLTPKEQARKKELANKYRVFNDISRVLTILAENDFREYAKLVLKEAKGDFKQFGVEILKTLGVDAKKYLPKLYEEIGGKGNVDLESLLEKPTVIKGKLNVPADYIRDLVNSGITDINELSKKVLEEVQKDLPDATLRQVRDAITDYGRTVNPTLDDVKRQINEAKRLGRLYSQLEDVEAGKKKAKLLKKYLNIGEDEKELKRKIKAIEDSLPKTEAETEQNEKRRRELKKAYFKKFIKEREDRLLNKNFAPRPKAPKVESDSELNDLEAKANEIRNKYEEAHYENEQNNRGELEKFYGGVIEVATGIQRALQAGLDFSALGVQGIIQLLSTNPTKTLKAVKEGLRFMASEKYEKEFFAKLQTDPLYPVMKKSGLALQLPNSKLGSLDYQLSASTINKIWNGLMYPLKLVSPKIYERAKLFNPYRATERAYSGTINTIRVQMFKQFAKDLQQQGITPETDSKQYIIAANATNNLTFRGRLRQAEPLAKELAVLFFAPRKITATFSLTNPFYYAHLWITSPTVAKRATLKMATFLTLATTITLVTKALREDDEEDENPDVFNPLSADFMKLRIGNTRINLFGGLDQNLVFYARFITNNYKSSGSSKTKKLGENKYVPTRWDLGEKFLTNKFAPTSGVAYRKLSEGKGRMFDWESELQTGAIPIWTQGISELQQEHPTEIATFLTMLNFFGISISTYGNADFLDKKQDEKLINLLDNKNISFFEKVRANIEVVDSETGETRGVTKDEFDKYKKAYGDYIKNNLKDNYSVYMDMSVEEFEKEMSAIKSEATEEARYQITNVIPETLTLEIDNVTYKLTPDKVAERKEYIQEYIDENEGKRSFERKIEKLIEAGTIKDSESAIRKILMSDAKRYATQKMKEDYEDNPEELGAVKD
jgi:hypothetical protein